MRPIIDISNYEEYVIDFVEGTLSEELKRSFEAFLLAYPDIALEIEDTFDADLVVDKADVPFQKDGLKIQVKEVAGIDADNYEEHFAFASDGDLDPGLDSRLEQFVDVNPALAKDLMIYRLAKLKPDHTIGYGIKADLKRSIPLWISYRAAGLRIAAGVLILFGIATLFNTLDSEIYIPRSSSPAYGALGRPTNTVYVANEPEVLRIEERSVASKPKRANVESIAVADMPSNDWATPAVLNRPQPSLAFAAPQIVPENIDESFRRAPELSIAQFLGKELLGVQPEEVSSTKDVLKEGAMNVLTKNDQIAMNTTEGAKDRKTFSLMAAGIEFKRVTYKSN